MAHPNDDLIQRFYAALGAGDGATMTAAYAPDATFSDPAFGDLKDGEPGAMWRMLTGRSHGLEVDLVEHEADDERGHARWIADYTFAGTGRHVRNDIRSQFRFRDGLIAEQHDTFSLRGWARQALGPMAMVLGWTPLLAPRVRSTARAGLEAFMENERAGA